jgi:hypothetical protein
VCGKPSLVAKRDIYQVNMNTAAHDTGMLTGIPGDWHHWCFACYPGAKTTRLHFDGSVSYRIDD